MCSGTNLIKIQIYLKCQIICHQTFHCKNQRDLTVICKPYRSAKIFAKKLHHYSDRNDVLILALPRGGVPVTFEVIICLSAPEPFIAVSKWYKDFNLVCDEEVHRLLKISWRH
jgi:hypothetical protein